MGKLPNDSQSRVPLEFTRTQRVSKKNDVCSDGGG
jgi:hypothetical protein